MRRDRDIIANIDRIDKRKQERIKAVRALPRNAKDGDQVVLVTRKEKWLCTWIGNQWRYQQLFDNPGDTPDIDTGNFVTEREAQEIVLDYENPPLWLGTPPSIVLRPGQTTRESFESVFQEGNSPSTFSVYLADRQDGSGALPVGFQEISVIVSGYDIVVDATRIVSTGTLYYSIGARERSLMAEQRSGYGSIQIQAVNTNWDTLPELHIFEMFSGTFNFSPYITVGVPTPDDYTLQLRRNPQGDPITDPLLIPLTGSLTGQTISIDATGVTLTGEDNEVVYYRIIANLPGGVTVASAWAMLRVLNSFELTYDTLDPLSVQEGNEVTLDLTQFINAGRPMEYTNLRVDLFRDTSGNPIIDVNLDTEFTVAVDSNGEATFSAAAVSGLSTDTTVYYQIYSLQTDPAGGLTVV